MQYQVLLDPARIASVGLSVSQVESALTANNDNSGGGFYSQGGQFYYVRGLGRLTTLEDIGNVVLAVHDGIPVLVKDVGRVAIGIAPRLGEFGFQNQDDAVEGVILLRTGEKTQDVLKRVEAKTRELNEQILPKDVKVLPFYDRSNLVELTTQTVERNLLRGMLLVIVILIFFLYDFRAGLIVATSIPLALLFAFICLDLQNASANLLSIGAVDFGILVDGAVVMVENIFRQIVARKGNALNVREITHILPVGATGSADHVRNGVALSPTYHRAFDAGLIYLDESHHMRMNEGRLQVLQQLNLAGGVNTFRAPLGQQIFLPPDPNQHPTPEFIRRGNRFRQIAV